MYRIGLTGGVGCGKSTVSSYMARLGLPVIDGDKLSREAVTPGSDAMERIRQVFGPEVFLPDGSLDRVKMARLVFSDEDKRQALNAIIHPYVWKRTEEGLIAAQDAGHPIAVLDMPLLLEIGWQLRSEAVWVVKAPVEQQILRVCARDGATREEALARIRKQMPTLNKLNYADVVIDNSGSVEDARRQVREAPSRTLCLEDLLVHVSQTGGKALAHKGTQLGAIFAHKVDALRGLEAALLEHGVHAVAGVALEGVKIAGEFVFCVHAPILAERGQRHRADPAGRSPVLSGGPRPPPAPQASRWSSRQSDRAPR